MSPRQSERDPDEQRPDGPAGWRNDTHTKGRRTEEVRSSKVGRKPVDEGRLHAQTVNGEVAEDELVELNLANETCEASRDAVSGSFSLH